MAQVLVVIALIISQLVLPIGLEPKEGLILQILSDPADQSLPKTVATLVQVEVI